MASNNQQAPPDLASILRTLAGLAPQAQPQQDQPIIHGQVPSHFEQPQQSWTPIAEQVSSIPRSTTPTEPPPPKNVVDPASIIEWSAGLRCVMKTVARHENVLNDIRKVCSCHLVTQIRMLIILQMMKVQREHEEQWWNGREILIEKQKARKEGQKKLDDVL